MAGINRERKLAPAQTLQHGDAVVQPLRCCPYAATAPPHPMTRIPPSDERLIAFRLPIELLRHLDRRAAEQTLSRAAMLRQLIIDDRNAA